MRVDGAAHSPQVGALKASGCCALMGGLRGGTVVCVSEGVDTC